jgi:hypothetical protein
MTGHVTPDVFRRYDIVSEADQAQATALLAAFLSGKATRKTGQS